MTTTVQTIPARRGKAVRVNKGQSVKVINTHGNQVVDFWAFNAGDLREYLGMEHCRAFWTRLFPVEGDKMVTNRRRPILTMTKDASPGRHDTVIPPCDKERYGFSAPPWPRQLLRQLALALRTGAASVHAGAAQPVHEHPVDGRTARCLGAAACASRATTWRSAPRWIPSWCSPPARRTSCRSTTASPRKRISRCWTSRDCAR